MAESNDNAIYFFVAQEFRADNILPDFFISCKLSNDLLF